MNRIITIASVAAAGIAGYLIRDKKGESADRSRGSDSGREKAAKAKSKRQQQPAKAAAATLLTAQRATARSRKKNQKLQKARNRK